MHFNIIKPQSNDYFSLGVMNDNYDEIDDVMYANQQSAAKVMVGATSLADGESGRVTAPTIADKDKYLKGDGTWDTPSSGGGGGSTTLDGLTDVSISSPTNGQVLKYNSTSQEWENANESGGGGGGGSTVTITPTLSSGTKIADYSIDGVNNSLYAPSGGGGGSHTYSTTEHRVGTWIDGSDVYEKTIVLRENGTNNYTYLNSIFSQSLPANINWINIESFYAKRNSGGWVDCMNNQQEIVLVPNPTTQGIYFYSAHAHIDVTITIRYTKTGGNS